MKKDKSFIKVETDLLKEKLPQMIEEDGAKVRDMILLWLLYRSYVYRADTTNPLFGTCFLSQDQIHKITGIRRGRQKELNDLMVKYGMVKIVKMNHNGKSKNVYIPLIDQ